MTEAECLLRSGAMYRNRVGLLPSLGGGELIFVGAKPGGVSIFVGDAPIYHFDLEGRWQRAYLDDRHYLKALDTSVMAVERVREDKNLVLVRRTLPFEEAVDVDARVRDAAIDLAERVALGKAQAVAPPADISTFPTGELLDFLDRVAAWDASAWFRHRERFSKVYGPWPVLAPDAAQPIVLQASVGQRFSPGLGGKPGHEHLALSVDEFRAHVAAVGELWGRRIEQTREIQLAGPDVVARPAEEVEALLQTIARALPMGEPNSRSARRIRAVVEEGQGPPSHPLAVWKRFRELRLSRVDIAIESLAPSVREQLGRPETPWDVATLWATLGEAGLERGLILLTGLNSPEHLTLAIRFLEGLDLQTSDLIALLDAREMGSVSEPLLLDPPAALQQRLEFKQAIEPLRQRHRFKVMVYDPDKRWT